jgi:hypothetical protein
MRKHPRRAEVDPNWPQGWASSDRNGAVGNLAKMRWQHEWRGPKIINTKVLVHEDELDEPQRQLGSPALLGPDPPALINARPEQYAIDEYPVSTRVTMDGRVRGIMQSHGAAPVNLIVTVPGGVIDGTFPSF